MSLPDPPREREKERERQRFPKCRNVRVTEIPHASASAKRSPGTSGREKERTIKEARPSWIILTRRSNAARNFQKPTVECLDFGAAFGAGRWGARSFRRAVYIPQDAEWNEVFTRVRERGRKGDPPSLETVVACLVLFSPRLLSLIFKRAALGGHTQRKKMNRETTSR
jgi:hypothetical protein